MIDSLEFYGFFAHIYKNFKIFSHSRNLKGPIPWNFLKLSRKTAKILFNVWKYLELFRGPNTPWHPIVSAPRFEVLKSECSLQWCKVGCCAAKAFLEWLMNKLLLSMFFVLRFLKVDNSLSIRGVKALSRCWNWCNCKISALVLGSIEVLLFHNKFCYCVPIVLISSDFDGYFSFSGRLTYKYQVDF